MKKNILLIVFALFFLKISYSQQVNGYIHSDSGNVKVIKVWGTHYERGYAYGYLCANSILSVWNNFVVPNYGIYLPYAETIIDNPNNFFIDTKYISEVQGMLAGIADAGIDTTDISYKNLLIVNFITDIKAFLYKNKEIVLQNCSSLINWGDATNGTDLNGKTVISHLLDNHFCYDTAIAHNQHIVVHFPSEADEQPWLLTGTAGQIVGCQGVNNAGLSVFLNTVGGYTAIANKSYEPIGITMRKALEVNDYNNDGIHNVNDFKDAVLSNNNGYAGGFIVTSAAPSTAGNDDLIAIVAELAPQQPYITFRNNNDSDLINGDNLYAANGFIKRNNQFSFCSRYINVSNSVNYDYNSVNIGSEDNWNIMKTESNQGPNLQFIQVIPENRILKFSVYDNNSAYELSPYIYNLDDLFLLGNINELNYNKNEIFIYPNPVINNSFTIKSANSEILNIYEIFDINGKLVFSSTFKNKTTIDVSGFSKGFYIVKVCCNDRTFQQKLIKE